MKDDKRKEIARRILSVIGLVVFFNIFLFHKIGGMAFVICSIGLFVFLLGIFHSAVFTGKKTLTSGFLIILLISDSILITRTGLFPVALNTLFVTGLLLSFAYLLVRNASFWVSLGETVFSPLNLLKEYLWGGKTLIQSFFDEKSDLWSIFSQFKLKRIKMIIPLLAGFIISFPIIFILVSLLRSADPIYSSYIKEAGIWLFSMFKGDFWNRLAGRIIISIFVLGVFSPFIYLKKRELFQFPLKSLSNYPFVSIWTVVMALVFITLGSFIVTEWPYIFVKVANELNLSKYGVATYSEYVNRGFGELILVSIFLYSLIWCGLLAIRSNTGVGRPILSYIQLLVIGEFLVFILSIARRVILYVNYHGWSLSRIYGSFLLIFITGFAITLGLRHFYKTKWITAEILFTVLLVLSATYFNAENFLVNTRPPTVNNRIDYVYLSRLSPDGYEGWLKAYAFARNVLLDENLSGLSFYDVEKRREIAYAGLVTHMLVRNLEPLISQYGNPQERKDYYTAVLLQKKEEIGKISLGIRINTPIIESLEERLPNGEIGTTVFPTPTPQQTYFSNYTSESIRTINDQIDKDLKALNSKEAENFTPHYRTDTWSIVNIENYSLTEAPRFYYIYTPADGTSEQGKPAWTLLDKIFMWNRTKADGYEKMKKEIPYTEIIRLEKSFNTLFGKIALQDSNNRSFSSDISFDGPFLRPL